MNYLKKLFFPLKEQQELPPTFSPPSLILTKLPLELLLYIIEFLPSESAVTFSLSCKYLKCALGTQQFSNVASSRGNTLALLNLLERDLQNHVFCYTCKRLHDMANLRRYNSTTYSAGSIVYQYDSMRLPACVSRDRNEGTGAITYRFGATAFKMVVKRWHQKPDCTELLKIISSENVTTRQMKHYDKKSREEYRVFQGRLLQRVQVAHISRNVQVPMPLSFCTCPHMPLRKTEYQNGTLIKCQVCRTEYRIDIESYDGHQSAIYFTRWKDLGTGPESEVWIRHIPLRPSASLRSLFVGRDRALSGIETEEEVRPQGDVASSFGYGEDFKFDSMLLSGYKDEL